MIQLPYMICNRNHNFYIRIVHTSKGVRDEYRFSLQTKNRKIATSRYYYVMPRVSEFKTELKLRNTMKQSDEINLIKKVKRDIESLIEKADESNPEWMRSIASHKLMSNFNQQLELIQELESQIRLLKSERRRDTNTINSLNSLSVTTRPEEHSDSLPLSEACVNFINEKADVWSSRTANMNKLFLTRFCEIVGLSKPTQQINGAVVKGYSEILVKLPKNAGPSRNKLKDSDETILFSFWRTLASGAHPKVLLAEGIESHYSAVKTFLKWLHERHLIAKDYSRYLTVGKKKLERETTKREQFSQEQLQQIFSGYVYSDQLRKQESPKEFHFWLPLIALTTGMRVAEISGLEPSDVKQINGLWVFDVNETWSKDSIVKAGFSKHKKNKYSIRVIPVPQSLINLGLIEYSKHVQSKDRLLHDLHVMKNKALGEKASSWFNSTYLPKIGLNKTNADGSKVTFHSFRHTFCTQLNLTSIDGRFIESGTGNYITGHEQIGVKNQKYVHEYPLDVAKEFIDAIDFGIDLNALSYSNFKSRKKPKQLRIR